MYSLFSSLPVGAGLAPAQNDVSDLACNDVTSPDPLDHKLTRIGEILDKHWNEIPAHYKNVTLDEYIIMPNHNDIIVDFQNWWYYSLCGKELKV